MNFQILVSTASDATVEQFWKAMHIWLNNPQLINRRISSCVNLLLAEMMCDRLTMIKHLSEVKTLPILLESNLTVNTVKDALDIVDKCTLINGTRNLLDLDENQSYLFVNKFLPRNSSKFSPGIEFIIVDKVSKCIWSFYRDISKGQQCLGLKHKYRIMYSSDKQFSISIENTNADSLDSCSFWLRECLFPRLLKWIESDFSKVNYFVAGSLNLISSEKYTHLYCKLKQKYGSEMVKKWPECTDPHKYVFEDIAIATYLILLWEKERSKNGHIKPEKKQSFLDLGCGNGLLVYILTSEGHPGMGIDLRKRRIWDIYPTTTHLEERTIVPSPATLFPEVDWLIGNHSDELTPWIPVIAARSSYNCRFFLLPCCAHEFNGGKFQRDSAANSQYFEYLKYIHSVCRGCGFETHFDKLRIPSTKRVCLIGLDRTYRKEEVDAQNAIIIGIINARSSNGSFDNETSKKGEWSADFKPRNPVDRVRNCTQIDKSVIDEVISVVTSALLREVRLISLMDGTNKTWNAGGKIELNEIAKIVSPEILKQLKKECGGLQTLLKNKCHIFRVTNGKVQLNVPGTEANTNRKKNRKDKKNIETKVKPCWFYHNHPDGCFTSNQLCTYKH